MPGLIAHWLGLNDPGGHIYLFWSGAGSDLGELAIVGVVWHRLNCSVKGCWRIGLRQVPGTSHVTCHKHHPHGRPTSEQIMTDYQAAQVESSRDDSKR